MNFSVYKTFNDHLRASVWTLSTYNIHLRCTNSREKCKLAIHKYWAMRTQVFDSNILWVYMLHRLLVSILCGSPWLSSIKCDHFHEMARISQKLQHRRILNKRCVSVYALCHPTSFTCTVMLSNNNATTQLIFTNCNFLSPIRIWGCELSTEKWCKKIVFKCIEPHRSSSIAYKRHIDAHDTLISLYTYKSSACLHCVLWMQGTRALCLPRTCVMPE